MATKLSFSSSNFDPTQRVEVKQGQVQPVKAAMPMKTSTVTPKERGNGTD